MTQIPRRDFLKTAGAASAAALAANPGFSSERAQKPNIIFIMADDLGYGDVGCYGQRWIQTPQLDRMASEGMRFTQCYAGSTVCAPSRSCLMTGQHTGRTRVRGNKLVPLLPEDITVAEHLKKAGYATGIFGKWGLGEPDTTGLPNRKGFDEWFGYLNQKNAHNYYPPYLWRNEEKVVLNGEAYSHDLVAQEALDFVKRHSDEPFFLYLPYTIPHAHNEAGEKGMEVPSDAPYSDRPWPEAQRNHAAMITRMDRDVGRLLDLLQSLGIDENTIVFFTSDNGPHREGGGDPEFFNSNGPLRGLKRDLYDGGIRVPMLARWPGKIQAGAVSDQVWAFWDFLPTASELAGVDVPKHIDGISMAPALLGKPQEDHDYLYWEFHERGFHQAVRMGDWKGIRRGGKHRPVLLYNLKDDPGEQSSLSAEHPDIAARIAEIMETARTESPQWPVGG